MGFGRKLNKIGRKNTGLIAIVGLVLASMVFVWPEKTQQAAQSVEGSDIVGGLLKSLGLVGQNLTSSGSWVVHVKYESQSLEEIGKQQLTGVGAEFDATGTAASGLQAKFQMKCGTKVCGQITDSYQEPTSYWAVTVPMVEGLTSLIVTAGSAVLEVKFG